MQPEPNGTTEQSPTDRPCAHDGSEDHRPSPKPQRRDDALTDGGQDPGSVESRLEEIDKQAGIVLDSVDERGLESTTRRAVENYLETIRFEVAAVDHLLEYGTSSDDEN